MTSKTLRIALFVLALSYSTLAQAQVGNWYVAPSIVWADDDRDRAVGDSVAGAQIVVGRDMTEHLSLEGLLGYTTMDAQPCEPGDCFPDLKFLDVSANLLAYYNRDWAFSPYVVVGVGFLKVDGEEGPLYNWDTGVGSGATASFGLGFKWRMGDSKLSIRGEYRGRNAFSSGRDGNLLDTQATIGVQYDFGARASSVTVAVDETTDTDGDGVLDMWDACDNTPPGTVVTSRGCELTNVDRDDDEDRINNNADECPNTPLGVPVDRRGCPLDSDGDGVTTDKDRCPASRTGAEVNVFGCEVDNDKDGVPDHRDDCLFTKAGVRVDVKGCEISDIISLPGVNFETGFDMLLPGTEYLLETAAATLKKYPEMHIEVAGHTDDVGNAAANAGLSERRARTVRHFLIEYGVEEERLTFKGYGEAEPIADNSTAEGRATNRRVELRLISR
jgi:OOP family OmpA-OmpF porin